MFKVVIGYGYTSKISRSNKRNNKPNIKKDILNCVLVCPKKAWNPHSNGLFFSSYGLCGANIKFIASNKKTNINTKKI